MSKPLGEYLITAKKITEEQLLQVLERQVTEGGRLGTNLIELGYITEEELTHFLSEKFQAPIVPQVVLEQIPRETIHLVPKEIAIRYEMIPFENEKNTLRIAVADPTIAPDILALQELRSFELQFHIASEVRIQYFLKKYYHADTQSRFVSILQKERTPLGPKVDSKAHGNGSEGLLDSSKVDLYLELAKKDLQMIQDRDQAIKTLVKYLALFLERVYCFAVKRDKISFWMGVPEEEGHDLTLPTDDLPLFKEVIQKKTFYDGPMISYGMEKLIETLKIQVPPQVIVVPMTIKEHVVCVIYGDNFFSRRAIPHVPIIKRLVSKTSMALEILILRKKINEA